MASYERLTRAKAAAKRYVQRLEPDESVVVLRFSDGLFLHVPLTRLSAPGAIDRVQAAIDTIEAVPALTFMRDALYQLIGYLETLPGRKVLILLTDGADTSNIVPAQQVVQAAASTRLQNLTMYPVAIGDYPDVNLLAELASVTGGQAYAIGSARMIDSAFQAVRDRLDSEVYVTWATLPLGQGPKDRADEDLTIRSVDIRSKDTRCKIVNPRENRFLSAEQEDARRLVPNELQPLPAVQQLPIGRRWRDLGFPEATMFIERKFIRGRFVDRVREWGEGNWTTGGQRMWGQEAALRNRQFEAVVPPIDELLEGHLSRPEDIPLFWFINNVRPASAEGTLRSPQVIHGATFLELRLFLAEALYGHYASYREWANNQLSSTLERVVRYRFPDVDEGTITRLLDARFSQPYREDTGLHLATWLGDISARGLALALERRVINLVLSSSGSRRASAIRVMDLIVRRWGELLEWFPQDPDVRVVTPLVPLYDAERSEIGFVRVILPRTDGEVTVDPIPELPLATSLAAQLTESNGFGSWRVATIDYQTRVVQRKTKKKKRTSTETQSLNCVSLRFVQTSETETERDEMEVVFLDEDPSHPVCVLRLPRIPSIETALADIRLLSCPEDVLSNGVVLDDSALRPRSP